MSGRISQVYSKKGKDLRYVLCIMFTQYRVIIDAV